MITLVMKKTVYTSVLLISALMLICSACVKEGGDDWSDVINYVEVGDKIPQFIITEADGSSISSDNFIGKRSVIVLFTTTCGDCRRELPILNDAYKAMKGKEEFTDLLFVGLAREDTPEMTKKFWKDENLIIPVYHDTDRSVFGLFANSTVPRVYVVDKQGNVTWMAIEELNITADGLIEKVRAIK